MLCITISHIILCTYKQNTRAGTHNTVDVGCQFFGGGFFVTILYLIILHSINSGLFIGRMIAAAKINTQ